MKKYVVDLRNAECYADGVPVPVIKPAVGGYVRFNGEYAPYPAKGAITRLLRCDMFGDWWADGTGSRYSVVCLGKFRDGINDFCRTCEPPEGETICHVTTPTDFPW